MLTDDQLVTAMLTAAAQLNLAIEYAKDRRLAKILERVRNSQAWLNAAIAEAAMDTVVIDNSTNNEGTQGG